MNSTFTKLLRMILALLLLVFGANKIYPFLPIFSMPPAAANFMESLQSTGYVLYVVAVLEICIGLLLLFRKWVPFALLVLAPISINILLFHLFLDVSSIWVAIVIVALNAILIYKYWQSYRQLFH
ncbi:DoxX family membrane protein [Jejudonia soesokkakensis]|uniref:DoxX family membrane protein n=1 Tax=Jejudonia soesokkakensis TaxID=1323432 RepID=A0ABW2MPC6_9FLAO